MGSFTFGSQEACGPLEGLWEYMQLRGGAWRFKAYPSWGVGTRDQIGYLRDMYRVYGENTAAPSRIIRACQFPHIGAIFRCIWVRGKDSQDYGKLA